MQIQSLAGDVVRSSAHQKRMSKFYVAPVIAKEDCNNTEESKELPLDEPNFAVYCQCGNLCNTNSTLCNDCLQKQEPIEYSSSLYIPDKNGLKLIWVHLINKEIYCKLLFDFRF